jgi:hypothetical protein
MFIVAHLFCCVSKHMELEHTLTIHDSEAKFFDASRLAQYKNHLFSPAVDDVTSTISTPIPT